MNALQEMNIYLSQLDEMEEEKPDYLNLAGCVSLHYKILQNLKCEKQEDALNYAVKAEFLLKQPIYPYSREASILLTISASVAFFKNNQFSRSGKLLRMLDLHEFSLSLLPVFYTAKLMFILIHFENNQYDVMEAEIRAFLRWLKKYLKDDEREKWLMKFLIHFPRIKNVLIKEHLKDLALQNEKLPASDVMVQSIQLFDWLKWLLKKMR